MNIDELLNRYFEGETSAGEEQELRRFFASADVPERLQAYRPLFAYFDEEIAAKRDIAEEIWSEIAPEAVPRCRLHLSRKSVVYLLLSAAACVLAFLTVNRWLYPADSLFCSDNYVVINGRCYTDIHKVRSLAFEALQEVATPADAYFPAEDNSEDDREIIDNQLKELSSIFTDEE